MNESVPAVYQLKVILSRTKPPIWRRFQARGDITFYELHKTLQVVMGWQNYHLHQFAVDGLPITDADTLAAWDGDGVSEDEARLDEYVTKTGQAFTYEYDFGDGWQHKLLLEKVLPAEPAVKYPRCLAGRRACPPEDIGGVWGYQFFLEAIADPEHEEHESYLEWIGGEFDPESFDPAEVSRQFREGVRWQGELVLAPLTSSKELTRPALWFWDSIPEHIQAHLLGSVWCPQCRGATTIVDFKGNIKDGNLVLRGQCLRCSGPVGRVIEGE